MTPRLSHILITAGVVIALLGAVVFGLDAIHKHKGESSQTTANIESGVASAHQSQAQAHDATVENLKAQLSAREADVGRLSRERDALLRKLASVPKPGAGSAGDNLSPTEPVGADDSELEMLRATVEKDAEVIEALEADSVVKDSLITAALRSRDEWKATAEARERQALAQEAATEAWKKAVVSSRWRGRFEGFAAGVALGYAGGKL